MRQNKAKSRWINQDTNSLFLAILQLKSVNEARRFFRDLLAEKEIIEFGQRWKVAQLLNKKIPYVKISKETGLSSTTIARVHKWLKKGLGGYKLILERLEKGR